MLNPPKIYPPFSAYHPARLERIVREIFEAIERDASKQTGWGQTKFHSISNDQFRIVVAADAYLRSRASARPLEDPPGFDTAPKEPI